jgi:hypothetical protein
MGTDKSGRPVAKFFNPCTDIISVSFDADFYEEVLPPMRTSAPLTIAPRLPGAELFWSRRVCGLHRFGVDTNRNQNCFVCAIDLVKEGATPDEIYKIIFAKVPTAPDFTENEKRTLIKSAFNFVRRHAIKGSNSKTNDGGE